MLKLEDEREQLFQWDLNRRLIVEDTSVNEVHYCNRTDDYSLVCKVYEENGLRFTDIPNILLQENFKLRVYGYDKEFTKFEEDFKIIPRSKPADYVYTPTEIKSFEALEARVETLETSGYQTESQVNTLISNALAEIGIAEQRTY